MVLKIRGWLRSCRKIELEEKWHFRGALSHQSSNPWLSREEAAVAEIQENLKVAWEQDYHIYI